MIQESVEEVFHDEIERMKNHQNQFRVLVDTRFPQETHRASEFELLHMDR